MIPVGESTSLRASPNAANHAARHLSCIDNAPLPCHDATDSPTGAAQNGHITMSSSAADSSLTREQLAWEFAELFNDLSVEHVNEMLAKNVPMEILRFATRYNDDFAEVHGLEDPVRHQLPNIMVLGYLLRVLEEKLLDDGAA